MSFWKQLQKHFFLTFVLWDYVRTCKITCRLTLKTANVVAQNIIPVHQLMHLPITKVASQQYEISEGKNLAIVQWKTLVWISISVETKKNSCF